ncbi:MAG: hypothetical protein NC115_05670 [Bacteroidales bacterium]|nr:hypothetical protein [Bacteroides sp.]MCM1197982.1 hypothetical protein [Clostridium sp.]MCM1502137.1 hypothetical protein [Bacteroidales bacterium]
MKRYKNNSGKKVVLVEDLSFLSDRQHFNWIQRHYRNIRHRRACRGSDIILAANEKVATDLVKYYFIPKSRIHLPE